MEETLTPDVKIDTTSLVIGTKTYSRYCEHKTRKQAQIIKDDLIASGYDSIIRSGTVDTDYTVWWRKK